MTDFLQDEQIYSLNDKTVKTVQEKVEGIDTVVLISKPLADYSETVSNTLKKLIQVVGKQESHEIIDHSSHTLTLQQIVAKYRPDYVFTFGLSPKNLSLNISCSLNQIVQMESERIIFCEDLDFLEDATKKKAIWPILQRFFRLV